jgi:hypothetical protein
MAQGLKPYGLHLYSPTLRHVALHALKPRHRVLVQARLLEQRMKRRLRADELEDLFTRVHRRERNLRRRVLTCGPPHRARPRAQPSVGGGGGVAELRRRRGVAVQVALESKVLKTVKSVESRISGQG